MYTSEQLTIYKNSLVIMVARLLSMAASFLIVPFIISSLGLSGYGVWESMMAITAFATLILTSISQTLMWRISISYGTNDIEAVKSWFSTGIFFTLIQVLVLVPLIYFFRWELIELFDIPKVFAGDVALLLPIVCGIMLMGGIHECAGAVLSGFQRSGYVILCTSITTIIGQTVSLVFLFSGFGLASIALGFMVNTLLAVMILNWKTRIVISNLSFVPRIISRTQLSIIKNFFLLTFIGSVILLIRNHVSKLILSSMASQESVANYGIAARLSSLVFLAVTFLVIPTITAVASAFARKDQKTIQSIYSETLSTFSFLNNLITLLLCVLVERLLVIWLGFYTEEIINFSLILLVGQSVAVLTTAIGVAVCTGIGRRDIETHYIVFNLLLNIVVLIVLINLIGPIGSVIACSATWAISGFFFVFILHKKIELPITATKASFLSLSVSLLLVGIFRYINHFFKAGDTRLEAIIESFVIGGVAIAVYFLINKILKLTPAVIPFLIKNTLKKIKK